MRGYLKRRGITTKMAGVAGLIALALVLDAFVLATAAYAQAGAADAGGGTTQLPVEFQIFLSLVNAGGFVLAVWGFIKGWMVPGYIHIESLERESGVKTELATLRTKVEVEFLAELRRSREAHERTSQAMNRMTPLIERFIIFAERFERQVGE